MSIQSDDFELTTETEGIQGFWIDLGSRVEKDSGWVRIEWLLNNRLEKVIESDSDKGALYRNPADDSLWHHYLVAPGMAAESPPALERMTADAARKMFGQF
ncbi:MAG: hypothetical protein JXQ81_12915 [Desulfuromonadales bacterium]|nr:hypothetical protein [Desulfuromonadales bacterium]MBN2793404.1 hypothetical protein [Desulfuromonadales bacterium]